MNPSLTSQLAADRRASLLAERPAAAPAAAGPCRPPGLPSLDLLRPSRPLRLAAWRRGRVPAMMPPISTPDQCCLISAA